MKIDKRGQSLLEVILAMAVFALFSFSMISLSAGGFISLSQGGDQTEAEALAQEGIEAVRAIGNRAWNELIYTTSSVSVASSEWMFDGEGLTQTIGQYMRTISFADVCRNGNDDIVDCPGSYIDLHSKKVVVNVSWEIRPGVNNEVEKTTYLTNWDSLNWTQTDWSGGSGQSIWSDETRYESDDNNLDYGTSGEIKLTSLGGGSCGAKTWTFDNAGNYNYDDAKIEVTGGVAQLISAGGGGMDSYTQGMWHLDESSGTLVDMSGNGNDLSNVKGSPQYSQSGKFNTAIDFNANSSRYINHGSQIGLNFTSSFSIEAWVYRDAPATTYESIVSKWRETGNKKSYALVINPSNKLELWVSNNGSNETVLTAGNTLPIGSWVHIVATYDGSNLYIFQNGTLENQFSYGSGIADEASFFSISGADKFNGGDAFFDGKIDEVRISNTARWTGSFIPPTSAYGPASYPTDDPTINPTISHTVTSIDQWSSFTETANKDGGEIYYQLSDDGGSTWQYWDGGAWSMAGVSDYNIATDINTNIITFSTTSAQIMFKAFLSSDGDQLAQLDEVSISCAQSYDWLFTVAGDYNYDSEKIDVSGGKARLISQSIGGSCSGTVVACNTFLTSPLCLAQAGCAWGGGTLGNTSNPDFNSTLSPWTSGTWGTRSPTLSRATTGGNPGGYAKIQFANTKNKTSGGYFQQSFSVTGDVDIATLNFDWIVSQYTGPADSLHLYVFVDTVAGVPTIGGVGQVWDSGNQTVVSSWATVSNINVTSKIISAGTYYLKIVAYLDYLNSGSNRQYAVGFDNVELNWTTANACSGMATVCNAFSSQPACDAQSGCLWSISSSYPTDNPTIYPMIAYSLTTTTFSNWTSFVETATKNGGEIYYQLSDDGGSTWQYWNGSTWVSAGASNYNTAIDVNSNIVSFPTSTASLTVKAFLSSDGTQLVELDNIKIGWGEAEGGGGSGFTTFGYLVSSAYNMGNASPVQILEWDEDVSGCTGCDIQLQIRTAPDASGSPGSWSGWYGEGGVGSYYTSPFGTLLDLILNGDQWVQYRAELSGDGTTSPVLQEVRINYK